MKLLAIDGNSIINRAFYGIKLLSTKTGIYTNGIYGFMNILGKLCEMEQPDGVAIAFDLKAPTFRHKEYAEYKAGRKPMPDELREQFPLLKKLLTLMGYTCLELEGYEADDILGTLANMCEQSGDTCVIATGDRDSFQLVSEHTKVLLSATKMGRPEITPYTPDTIYEKYGVTPLQMIEIKALQGDSSDNIPGVKGIGEKGAVDLIRKFSSIENIYENIDSIAVTETLRNKLKDGKDSAFLSHKLGTIYREVPLGIFISDLKTKPRSEKELSAFLSELEFFAMLQKLGLTAVELNTETEVPTKAVETVTLLEILSTISTTKECTLKSISGGYSVFSDGTVCDIDLRDIAGVLSDSSIKKEVYDSKTLYKDCFTLGLTIEGVTFDTTLAAYLINPSSSDYELGRLAAEYKVPLCKLNNGEISDVALTHNINKILAEKISNDGIDNLLFEIELPLARVLAEMETVGFSVDKKSIERYGNELGLRINELESSICNHVGYVFNVNSTKQLGEALFEKLELPCKKKTKRGYSTDAAVLEELKDLHPVISELLEYRTLTKLKSTYCDGLVTAITADGRIHSTLNQTETRTGRISSSEPNLQNIPVRRSEGKELRRFFNAKESFVLCDADYSQIELRVLAHIAGDENMINAFNSGTDIHTVTASQVFNMPESMVTPVMRSRAKAVNFGIVYGIGAYSLAKDIGVTNKEAAAYIAGYLATYPQVDKYMHEAIEKAKEQGFSQTMFGRRRLLPELKNSNRMLVAFGERVARNMPIQGTAADIIKIAMIKVSNRLKTDIPEASLIMQVHDELIVEAPEEKAQLACKILKEEMEKAVNLLVPLTVDAAYGKTWYDAKG
jgi:DNA polymerase-1